MTTTPTSNASAATDLSGSASDSSAPVVVTAVFTPRPETFDEVTAALSRAIAEVHEEPGCLLYAIHRDPDDRIVMIEKWASVESLDAHGTAPAVERLGASLEGLLAEPTVVTRMTPIPAGTEAQGQL
ncbi:MAG TPA: putative quinol monooxygenase [Propionibacteriaceae bacterium]